MTRAIAHSSHFAAIALLFLLLPTPGIAQEGRAVAPASLEIESGRISGLTLDDKSGLTVFRGIPYAAAPIGELRWRPPQMATSWDGVRACDRFGPIACQKPFNSDGSQDL